jgi:hypothetical protein
LKRLKASGSQNTQLKQGVNKTLTGSKKRRAKNAKEIEAKKFPHKPRGLRVGVHALACDPDKLKLELQHGNLLIGI